MFDSTCSSTAVWSGAALSGLAISAPPAEQLHRRSANISILVWSIDQTLYKTIRLVEVRQPGNLQGATTNWIKKQRVHSSPSPPPFRFFPPWSEISEKLRVCTPRCLWRWSSPHTRVKYTWITAGISWHVVLVDRQECWTFPLWTIVPLRYVHIVTAEGGNCVLYVICLL